MKLTLACHCFSRRRTGGHNSSRERAAEPGLTNTVALAALRSRRYFNRYFSFWLFFGSFFILALLDSGVRGSEARPPSRLMIRPQLGGLGLLGALRGGDTSRYSPALPRQGPKAAPPEVTQDCGHV